MHIIKFNVFGTLMSVQRKDQQWLLFRESDTGIRARVYDVIIPVELKEEELLTYLDDIYHEYASERHGKVIRVA